MKPAIFVPCYNCAPQLSRSLEGFSLLDLDVYFIDNFSSDSTTSILRSYCQTNTRAKLVLHHQNYGLGGSFKTALQIAQENGFEEIIWFHGDDQAKQTDIPKLIREMELSNCDAVFGARFMPGSKRYNYSLVRTIGNIALNYLASLLLGSRVYELGSGLNIFKTKSLSSLEVELWPTHIAFDMNLLIHYVTQNKCRFVPIEWHEEDQVSNARNFHVAFDVIKMLLRYTLFKSLSTTRISQNREYHVEN